MTHNVCSITGQPTVIVVRDYSEAHELFNRVARYSGKGYANFGGTIVTADNTVIGYYHTVPNYHGVIALKAAAEIESHGYEPHADAIRKQVGQASAMASGSIADDRTFGLAWLADIAEESADCALEAQRETANV
jgi:hypothetical protein